MNSKDLGLRLKGIRTRDEITESVLKDYQDVEKLASEMAEGSFISAYLYYKVLIGKVAGGKIWFPGGEIFNPRYLLKLRVFNQDQEILLWGRKGETFKKRLRVDNDSNGVVQEVIDAQQILWGTFAKGNEEWTTLTEERGTELTLPLPFSECEVNDQEKRMAITTRSYISYNNVGQAGYVDCRFVKFGIYEGRE
jgi:CRISPR-associated protein (TIGR03984 family)